MGHLYGKRKKLLLRFSFSFLMDNGPLQVWNGFDSAFIVIFVIFFGLRIKGLTSGEGM
jgi:hypothetical protein